MRRVLLTIIFAALSCATTLRAEDAEAFRDKGIAALKESVSDPRAIVGAARYFVKAQILYSAAGDEDKSVEMNSLLFWCKKKMTMQDIDAFTQSGEAAVATKLQDVEKLMPKADEAQAWYERAETFATKNPSEHLLIAIRFFEVADRFKGSDTSFKAQDRSLKELLEDKSAAPKSANLPAAIRTPDAIAGTAGSNPVPNAEQIKAAEKTIKDVFKSDYSKTDAAGRGDLAKKLIQLVEENKDDAVSLYVMLREARDNAILAGDAMQAAEAQKRLRETFKIDFSGSLLDLRHLEPKAKAPDAAAALAWLLTRNVEDALSVENYEAATNFDSFAEDLLPFIKDAAIKTRVKATAARMLVLKKASVGGLAALKTLTTRPDDPDANLAAGKYFLLRGEFDRAFALLAKSKDAAFKDLGARELAQPADSAQQSQLGDGWFDRAEKETSPELKEYMQERAALWYTSALAAQTGLTKLKIEKRLKQLPTAGVKPAAVVESKVTETPANELPKIKVLKVMYGARGEEIDNTEFWKEQLEASPYGHLFGAGPTDPSQGKRKTLTAQLLVNGKPQTFKVFDHEVVVWPWLKNGVPTAEPGFKIYSAHWGGQFFVDVTKRIQDRFANPSAEFVASELSETDPAPGVPKVLAITYAMGHRIKMITFNEGDMVKLPSDTNNSQKR